MQRNAHNLKLYKETGIKVMERADNMCEVMLDENGHACSDLPKITRCCKFISIETVTYTNFLHTYTRNGKSDEWINDPENIILGCASHHYEEGSTGKHVERCSYQGGGEVTYIPSYD